MKKKTCSKARVSEGAVSVFIIIIYMLSYVIIKLIIIFIILKGPMHACMCQSCLVHLLVAQVAQSIVVSLHRSRFYAVTVTGSLLACKSLLATLSISHDKCIQFEK